MVSKNCPDCNRQPPTDIPPDVYARTFESAAVELHRAMHRVGDELMEQAKRMSDVVLKRSWLDRIKHGRKQR